MRYLKLLVGILIVIGAIRGIIDGDIGTGLVMLLIGVLLTMTFNSTKK